MSSTLEALNPRTGEALAREQVEAPGKEQVLEKLGEAATKLRGKLGESLQTIEKFDARVEQATTSSLEALKAFSLGQQLQIAGKTNEFIPFHKRAVELDPNFASAYKNLGEAYFFTGQRDRAVEPFTKAFELRERVSGRERFNITARYYQHVVGDVDKTGETLSCGNKPTRASGTRASIWQVITTPSVNTKRRLKKRRKPFASTWMGSYPILNWLVPSRDLTALKKRRQLSRRLCHEGGQ